jgi:predicted aspartyl protease
MAYLYEKENHHWVNWNGGSNVIYPFHEYAPGETLIVGVECTFPQLGKVVEIEIALLDTGAQYSVVGKEIYAALSQILQPTGESVKMSTRRGSIQGMLERIEISLMADFGESLNLETIFFISEEWTGPTVLGFSTLSQMRMALDPFYPNPAAEPGRIFFWWSRGRLSWDKVDVVTKLRFEILVIRMKDYYINIFLRRSPKLLLDFIIMMNPKSRRTIDVL